MPANPLISGTGIYVKIKASVPISGDLYMIASAEYNKTTTTGAINAPTFLSLIKKYTIGVTTNIADTYQAGTFI